MYVHPDYVPILPWIDEISEPDEMEQFYISMRDYLADSRFTWYQRIGLTEQEAEAILDHAKRQNVEVSDKVIFCSEVAYYLETLFDRMTKKGD